MPLVPRALSWFVGPLVAIGVVFLVILHNAGPGAFVWGILAALGFLFIAPIIQWALLRVSKFRKQ